MSKPEFKQLTSFINFLASTSGRDKSCRTLQYFSKFLGAFIKNNEKNDKSELAKKFDNLGTHMSGTRKVLRFGRQVGIIMNIRNLIISHIKGNKADKLDKVNDQFYVVSKVLSDISLGLFFLCDHILWFGRIGFYNNPQRQSKADYLSNLFWLFECVFTICCDLKELSLLKAKLSYLNGASFEQQPEAEKIRQRVNEVLIDLIRSILDIPIAYGFMNDKFISQSLLGILGTITSLIGCKQAWK